jgi:hypothetical protein
MQVAWEGHRMPLCRVGLDLGCDDFGQRITEVMTWPRRMHPIREPRREHFSISADDVRADPQVGDGVYRTEPVRQADAGV